jgi:hypothetical protein
MDVITPAELLSAALGFHRRKMIELLLDERRDGSGR